MTGSFVWSDSTIMSGCFGSGSLVWLAPDSLLCSRGSVPEFRTPHPYSIEINYLHDHFTFTAELQTVSDQYHRFDSNNGQVEVPPRYSDLYPRINSLDRTSTQSGRISTTGSVGSRSLSSFTRNSASRMSMRRVRNSGTLPREQSNESGANQTKEPLPKHPDFIVEFDQTIQFTRNLIFKLFKVYPFNRSWLTLMMYYWPRDVIYLV
jgi:hypothetical protein